MPICFLLDSETTGITNLFRRIKFHINWYLSLIHICAGKSILIGSINLALGGQAAKNLIRDPDQPALVELVFEVTNPDSLIKLQELDLYPEDGGLFILSRKLVNGRSIGKVNGEIVSAGVLKQIAEILINIHGQHEHQSLLYKKKHLEILDDYGSKEISPQKVKVREAYAAYSELKETYDATGMDEEQRTDVYKRQGTYG